MVHNPPSYSQYFALSDDRVRWAIAAIALILTIVLLLFIKFGMGAPLDRDTATSSPNDLLIVPVQPPPPLEVAPPAPVVAPLDPSAPPPPAPAAPVFLPEPQVVLTPFAMPSTDVVPLEPSRVVGDGMTASPGDGDGNGRGATAGDGTGGTGLPPPPIDLRVSWAPSMRMRWLRDYYPEQALEEGTRGLVVMNCEALANDRVRDCRVMSESPAGQGFSEAAIAAQNVYLVRVHDQNGNRVYNRRFRLRALFYPGD